MYVSVERFKTMGFGLDLTDVEDYEIQAKLDTAGDKVHAITSAPMEPEPHDFRGGTITDERHDWYLGDDRTQPPARSIWPWHYPILTCSSMQIDLTNNRYISIGETERYLTRRTVEIVSLAMTASGLIGAAVLPEIGLTHPQVVMSYTYGHSFTRTRVPLSLISDFVFRSQDQWWVDTEDVTVYKSGVLVDSADYTVDYDEGTVTFASDPGAGSFTASYVNKLHRNIASAEGILAAEFLGDREMRARGMSGLASVRVGEIALESHKPSRGGQTLVTPAEAAAEALLDPFRFISVGA